MSKELKALYRIRDFMSENAVHWKQDIAIIETALKDYENIKGRLDDTLLKSILNADTTTGYYNSHFVASYVKKGIVMYYVFTSVELYLDYRVNKKLIIAHLIGERIKQIIDENGTDINITIKKIKHRLDPAAEPPFTIMMNGMVRCHLENDKDYFYTPARVWEHLENNWFDYQIDVEKKEVLL